MKDGIIKSLINYSETIIEIPRIVLHCHMMSFGFLGAVVVALTCKYLGFNWLFFWFLLGWYAFLTVLGFYFNHKIFRKIDGK